jgi:hypothetical protein
MEMSVMLATSILLLINQPWGFGDAMAKLLARVAAMQSACALS